MIEITASEFNEFLNMVISAVKLDNLDDEDKKNFIVYMQIYSEYNDKVLLNKFTNLPKLWNSIYKTNIIDTINNQTGYLVNFFLILKN